MDRIDRESEGALLGAMIGGMNLDPTGITTAELDDAYQRALKSVTPEKTVRRLRHVLRLLDGIPDGTGDVLYAMDLIRQAMGQEPEIPEHRRMLPDE